MGTATIQERRVVRTETWFNVLDCPNCGVLFGISEEFEQGRRRNGAGFYCPNGHPMSYAGEIEQLRRRNKSLSELNERLSNDILDKTKETQRLKRRAKAGVCWCDRCCLKAQLNYALGRARNIPLLVCKYLWAVATKS